MATEILANKWRFNKRKNRNFKIANKKQEVSIMIRISKDIITAKQRTKIPLKYNWLRFRAKFLGLGFAKSFARGVKL